MTGSAFGDHVAARGGDDRKRDEAWVEERFGDVGPAPSNEIVVDPHAPPAPNVGRPCDGEVADD